MAARRGLQVTATLAILVLTCVLLVGYVMPSSPPENARKISRGELSSWTALRGILDAREVRMIMSVYEGTATVVELAEEGSQVAPGDLLVRFDSSGLEYEVIKYERNYQLGRSELDSLKSGELPLELRDLEMKLLEAKTDLSDETQYLEQSIELEQEGLVSSQEVRRQREKVAKLVTELETMQLRIKLTSEYLHPSALKRAEAKVETSEQELKLARRQLENCIIRSPASGTVVYKPHYFGSEFRTIRIGDSVYPNQPFMFLPDMSSLIVVADVPEAELFRVKADSDVLIAPLAFPGLELHGTVERIGSTAQLLPGQPDWQKFFRVVIGVKEADPGLRPGMSVTAKVLTYHNDDALLAPRVAIWWEDTAPFAKVVEGTSIVDRRVELGHADEQHVEVTAGLEPGDWVLVK